LSITLCASVFAQKVLNQSQELAWRVTPVSSNYNNNNNITYCGSYSKGILQIAEDQVVMTVRYPKEDFGVVMMDGKGKVKWEYHVNGFILSLCKLGDKVVAFYTKEWTSPIDDDIIKTINAVSLNPGDGKVITDKKLFENTSGLYIDPKINATYDGQFCYLLVRYTDYKGKRPFSGYSRYENIGATTDLKLIAVTKDLEIRQSQTLSSKAIKGVFIACCSLYDGSLAVISKNDKTLVAERFSDAKPTPLQQISTNADYDENVNPAPKIAIDPAQPDRMYLSLRTNASKRSRDLRLYAVDWKDGKITGTAISLDKEFAETLKQQNQNVTKNLVKDIEKIYPFALTVSAGKLVLVSQHHSMYVPSGNGPVRDYYEEIVVSVFNTQLSGAKHLVIPRYYESFIISGESIGANIKGNKLQLFYNVNTSAAALAANYTTVDLDNLNVTAQSIPHQGMPGDAHTEGDAIIWGNNTALLPYYITKGFGTKNWVCQLQSVSLQ
jgi:hypothetical protein